MLICPRCGKTSEEKVFIEAFCVDCYDFGIRLPKGLKVEVCKRCGRMRLRGEWQGYDRGKIMAYVEGKCRGGFSEARYDPDTGICTFTFERGGRKVAVGRPVEVERAITMCPDCNKASGCYFEAIVQLRGEGSRVDKWLDRLEKQLSRKTFISKIEEMHGGLDLYIGSSKAASGTLQALGLKPVISRKLFGKKDGKKLYRVTYAIRV